MPQLFADNVKSTLAVQLLSNSTTLRVADFSKFPTLGTGDFFKLVLSYGLDIEIVYVTAADAPGSSFTVTRAQDGTTARTFPGGETQVFIAPVASDHRFFQSLQDRANQVGTQDVSTITGLETVLDAKAPLDGVGTSGIWPITVTGNAATASEVPFSGVTSKPTTLNGYGINEAHGSASSVITYDGSSRVSTFTEVIDGANKVTTLTYNGDGTVNTLTTVYRGLTRVETMTYGGGLITGSTSTEVQA